MRKAVVASVTSFLALCLMVTAGCAARPSGSETGYWVWKVPNATGTLEILKLKNDGTVNGYEDFCEGAYKFSGTYTSKDDTIEMDLGNPKKGRRVLDRRGDALVDEKNHRTFVRPDKAPIDFDVKVFVK